MLLPDNVHPESTLWFNGALILKELKKTGEASLLDLFADTRTNAKTAITMPLFVLSLDWLFVTKCVDFNDQGKIALCS
jgi:hypothetical protein